MNKKFIFGCVLLLGIILISFAAFSYIKLNETMDKDCESLSGDDNKDNCYHSLAHKLNNRSICNSITNIEIKERARLTRN